MKNAILIFTLIFVYISMNGQKIAIDREVTMLALGDSYTIGETVAIGERWPHQFIDQLRVLGIAADYPDYIATTGWTTGDLIQGIQSMLDKDESYNLAAILIGVNNQYQGIDISNYEPDLRNIIDRALEIVGQDTSRVFILSIPDYAYTPFGAGRTNISEQIDDYNSIKRMVAGEYGIAFIDITPISRLGLSDPSLISSDGLHPSGNQYSEWVKVIIPRLGLSKHLSFNDQQFLNGNHLNVYPTPSGSTLYIESSLDIERIQIMNTNGSQISDLSLTTMPAQLDLSHLAPGIYTLWVSHKNSDYPDFHKTIIIQPN